MNSIFYFLTLILLLSSSQSIGLQVIDITNRPHDVSINYHIDYLLDEKQEISINNVTSPEFLISFQSVTQEPYVIPITSADRWIKMAFHNSSDSPIKKLLRHNGGAGHEILYFPKGNNEWTQHHSGISIPYSDERFSFSIPIFSLTFPPGTTEIFIQAKGTAAYSLSFTLLDPFVFQENSNQFYFFIGAFLGIFLTLIISNGLLFFRTHDISLLLYVLSRTLLWMHLFCWWGIGHQYLWPELGLENTYILVICGFSFLWVDLHFVRTFLNLSKSAPKLNRVFLFWSVITLFAGIYSVQDVYQFNKVANLFLLTSCLSLPISMFVLRHNLKDSLTLFLAESSILLSLVLMLVRNFGIIAFGPFAYTIPAVMLLCESILLGMALTEKFSREETLLQTKKLQYNQLREINQWLQKKLS